MRDLPCAPSLQWLAVMINGIDTECVDSQILGIKFPSHLGPAVWSFKAKNDETKHKRLFCQTCKWISWHGSMQMSWCDSSINFLNLNMASKAVERSWHSGRELKEMSNQRWSTMGRNIRIYSKIKESIWILLPLSNGNGAIELFDNNLFSPCTQTFVIASVHWWVTNSVFVAKFFFVLKVIFLRYIYSRLKIN